MTDSLHPAAARGFSLHAHTYAQARPEYPEAASLWLSKDLGLAQGKKVAEVGAGTGKFTQRLLQTEATVIAVEPIKAMRDQLTAKLPQVEALEGSAAELPLEDESVDALVCAQAFHWFASSQSLEEFARVLRPGGKLGLIWNYRDLSEDWLKQLHSIWKPYEADTPRYHPEMVRALFPHPRFSVLQEKKTRHVHTGPPETVIVSRVLSMSFVAAMEPPEQERVLAQLRHLVATHPDLHGKAEVSFPYETQMYWAEKG